MKLTYSSVHEPRWANLQHSTIRCKVKFDHRKQEHEFVASRNDEEPHGREIFNGCVDGKYGPIDEFIIDSNHGLAPPDEPQRPLVAEWPELLEFLKVANQENATGTIRGQVLVWSSMIETLVTTLVKTFLVNHPVSKKLLDRSLSTFSSRTDAAFSLGLISKSEHHICSKIREVRNHIAHNWSVTLDGKVESALRSLYDTNYSDELVWKDDIEYLIKFIYAGSCSMVAMQLVQRQKAAADAKRTKLDDAEL